MKHLGDITKINWEEVEPVDCVTGGSPCQDLSVAGKRAGLAGERSGLYMEQIRCVKELREKDVRNGRTGKFIRPRYMVWENVPGAFSSNGGKDFAAALEEAVKIAEPEAADVPVPEKGWPSAGCLYDEMGRWSVAWRVHDAQFWGVPQRRKRISLVCDFGGMSAPEILFERKGLSGDFEQSAAEGQGTTQSVEGSIGGTISFQERAGKPGGGNGILIQNERTGALSTLNNQAVCYGIGGYNSKGMLSDNPKAGIYEADTSRTIDLNGGNPSCNQGGIAVVQEIKCYGFKPKQGAKAGGIGYREEQAPTLNAEQEAGCLVQTYDGRGNGDGKTVCTLTGDHQNRVTDYTALCVENRNTYQKVTGPLMANSHPGSYTGQDAYNDMFVTSFAAGGFEKYEEGVGTLRESGGDCGGGTETLVKTAAIMVAGLDCRNGKENGDICGTLQSKPNGGFSYNFIHPVRVGATVRRLTPTECERLQGYPDGWTYIGEWVDSKGKKHKEADSPRYKALGNSIALPFWKWLLKRISAQYERNATLGSLFDGIGGFPLCWEQINGKGSARWASEIEEFPMAVTRKRFGNDQL